MKYLLEFLEHTSVRPRERAIGILGDLGRHSQFGEQTEYFKRLVQESQEQGIDCFVFTDFDKAGSTAWTLNGDTWSQAHRGLPDVFYDRSFRKKPAAVGKSNTRALTALGCTPINSADFRKLALDKYATYSKVSKSSPTGLIMPITEKFSRDGIVPFLSERVSCIIKPRFGSGGRGIIKVSKLDTGYELRYLKETQTVQDNELVDSVMAARRAMRSHKRAYIIQETVDVPEINGSVFDVRVIYQRGSNGEPLRTGMAARVSSPGKITANLHQGGDRLTLSQVLNSVFGQDGNGEIGQSIRLYAKEIFQLLDTEVGPIGEIGLDFLIDRQGRINLIEVNSIPGRSVFKILPEIRERAIKRPIAYAKHLLNEKSRD
jgi:glutathione synthase/RimK-type ligase-like ATP-grasp enzyme